jgi:hypothetical protein
MSFLRNTQPRGFKFANVSGSDPRNIHDGGGQVYHVNSVQPLVQSTMDQFDLSGVIKYRFRGSHGYFHGTNNTLVFQQVPASVRHWQPGSVDQFGNPILSCTGTGSH